MIKYVQIRSAAADEDDRFPKARVRSVTDTFDEILCRKVTMYIVFCWRRQRVARLNVWPETPCTDATAVLVVVKHGLVLTFVHLW